MTINEAIDAYGEAAEGSLSLSVNGEPCATGDGIRIDLSASRSGYVLLGNILLGMLEEADCKFSLEPFSAGSAYFRKSDVIGPGLYFHLQPCVSDLRVFPNAAGVGWICHSGYFDGVPAEERVYDPSYLMIEGDEAQISWFAGALLRVAATGDCASFHLEELARHFGTDVCLLEFHKFE